MPFRLPILAVFFCHAGIRNMPYAIDLLDRWHRLVIMHGGHGLGAVDAS
jgi:hypothetical protein